ncbi:MAG: hypothetical protein EP332_06345 [Bacteroidetes bacterium]|nr:MAG: hypothetical protein EP332_06345 [Bacteroidota bacterium]
MEAKTPEIRTGIFNLQEGWNEIEFMQDGKECPMPNKNYSFTFQNVNGIQIETEKTEYRAGSVRLKVTSQVGTIHYQAIQNL